MTENYFDKMNRMRNCGSQFLMFELRSAHNKL